MMILVYLIKCNLISNKSNAMHMKVHSLKDIGYLALKG